ncbi:phosphate acetyltransferase [Sporolactobacillus sp. THM7-7]|nr:phosphate acetyltransferase [Sporolactobacillus sp. THM7-7]
MANLFETLKADIKMFSPAIVFPESDDDRILKAVQRLAEEGIVQPILIGKYAEASPELRQLADQHQLSFRHPETEPDMDRMVDALVERRKGKTDETRAREWLKDFTYYGTMLVYLGEADGLVSGAAHSTANTVRPALQIIKAQPGKKRISGAFIMVKDDEKLIFADCAINISPDSETLAEIADEAAETAESFGVDPRIAMLSFSTKGSAKDPVIDKVTEAVKRAKEKNPHLVIDGELQFDAAYVPSVAARKAPDSPIKGNATVFVFPNLEAGNIGYKMVQRLGRYEAIGPILQGLNKPVNDLSRGCSADDVYKLALITAKQAISIRQHQGA